MTRSRLAALALAAAALVWWLAGTPGVGRDRTRAHLHRRRRVDRCALDRSGARAAVRRPRPQPRRRDRPAALAAARDHEGVAITGKVIDQDDHTGVPDVEVVFKSELGESSTTSGADGSYRIEVSAGLYRAFVRDDNALSVGVPDLVRVPGLPTLGRRERARRGADADGRRGDRRRSRGSVDRVRRHGRRHGRRSQRAPGRRRGAARARQRSCARRSAPTSPSPTSTAASTCACRRVSTSSKRRTRSSSASRATRWSASRAARPCTRASRSPPAA